jgi:N-acetylglucosamine kinase-like BadF-type ATPase
MILIAESGSTKTNWVTEKNELYETIGFNPLFDTTETIYNELSKHEGLLAARENFTKVFFYGASCSSQERNTIVYNALKKYFTNAEVIHIDHDLKAAAIATYDGRPGIACILGTGSNSCLYDGTDIHEVVPSLGYVLGDEGSGAYFGKKLVAAYLYHELPEATNYIMKEVYKLEKEEVLKHVYNKPNANVYLARFAKVMNETTDKAYMDKLAEEGFTDFFNHHVKCYKNYQQYPVHFVGSIAFHFKHVLQEVANKMGCELGIVDRNPVYRLVAWHLKSNK